MAPPRTARTTADARWLAAICASRLLFSQIFVAYAAILPLLQEAWGMSSAQAGLVQSGWHAGYVVSLFAAGLAADRFGARRTFLVMSFGGAVASLAFAAFADGARSALILYALAGMLSGGSYTPVLAIISQRYPPAKRGRAMGWYLAAGSLGYAIGLGLSGSVVAWGGWRMSLYVAACAAVVGALYGVWLMRGVRDEPHLAEPAAPVVQRMREVLANRPAMKVIWAYTCHSWELLGVWAWMPAFLAFAAAHGAGLDTKAVGLGAFLAGLTHLTSVAGSLIGGALSDARGRTAVMIVMASASIACGFVFGWLVSAPLWVLVAVAMLYNLTGIGDSSVYSTALTEVVSARILGSAYAIRSVMGFGAGIVSPWVFGLVVDAGRSAALSQNAVWGLAWGVLALGALPGPLVALSLRRMPEAAAMAEGKR
ncbi:MAG TPA: MFS transporter [Usitatibacter sp.]|nr:MFS transporter [Usitatibacter sp.]